MKPYHNYFNAVLKALNAKPDQCIFIDDSPDNVRTAAKLGMRTILVKNNNLKEVELQLKQLGAL